MHQRSNVLHERQDDNMQLSVPILIGGRWVRCDRGRRLFPDARPVADPIGDLMKKESDECEEKWNFNFISEKPRSDGEWEWIPREDVLQSEAEEDVENNGQGNENDTDAEEDDEDDDDDDLQEVNLPPADSEDDAEGVPETKKSRIVPDTDNI